MCFLLCLPSEAGKHLKVKVLPVCVVFPIYRRARWSKPTACKRAPERAAIDRKTRKRQEQLLFLNVFPLQTVNKAGIAETFKCF